MASTAPESLIRNPVLGRGWTPVAKTVADHVSPEEIDAIWLFPPARRDAREWGVAVIARRAGNGRCRIYTASYMLVLRGRARGNVKISVEEVGESPGDVLRDIVAGVQDRTGESEPPVEIAPSEWFGPRVAGFDRRPPDAGDPALADPASGQ